MGLFVMKSFQKYFHLISLNPNVYNIDTNYIFTLFPKPIIKKNIFLIIDIWNDDYWGGLFNEFLLKLLFPIWVWNNGSF